MLKKKRQKIFKELRALKGLIRERGTSYSKLAEEMGIFVSTFSNKINGFACFNAIEMDELCDLLDIHEKDIGRYFFPHRVETK